MLKSNFLKGLTCTCSHDYIIHVTWTQKQKAKIAKNYLSAFFFAGAFFEAGFLAADFFAAGFFAAGFFAAGFFAAGFFAAGFFAGFSSPSVSVFFA